MRPQMVSKLPDDNSRWLYEPKLDGYRAIAVRGADTPDLYSMEGKLFNEQFPTIARAIKDLSIGDVAFDGELVAVEPTGQPNFNELQNSARTKLPIYYIVFDVLHHEGRDLLDVPLLGRKQILDQISRQFAQPLQSVLVFPEDLDLDGIVAAVKRVKIEGVVAKRRRFTRKARSADSP